jgi:hypothetical protein
MATHDYVQSAPRYPRATDDSTDYRSGRNDEDRVLRPWLHLSQERALARLRGPFLEAATRFGIASERSRDLTELIEQTRWRLVNPRGISPESFLRLEDRLAALEESLHRERTALWRDLLPLAERARDATIESMRLAWLAQVAKVPRGEQP